MGATNNKVPALQHRWPLAAQRLSYVGRSDRRWFSPLLLLLDCGFHIVVGVVHLNLTQMADSIAACSVRREVDRTDKLPYTLAILRESAAKSSCLATRLVNQATR